MLPSPTAEPIAERMNSLRVEKVSRFTVAAGRGADGLPILSRPEQRGHWVYPAALDTALFWPVHLGSLSDEGQCPIHWLCGIYFTFCCTEALAFSARKFNASSILTEDPQTLPEQWVPDGVTLVRFFMGGEGLFVAQPSMPVGSLLTIL